jgi:cyclopropane-fatty-acyl-phospholipid synthase
VSAGGLAVRAAEPLLRRGLIPDGIVRHGIRRLLGARLRAELGGGEEERRARLDRLVAAMREAPIAPATAAANSQHYEVPTRFFELALGPRLKYSSALWLPGTNDLAAAEEAMLELTARRAGIADGQEVLELGCGWGSLSMWLLERFPRLTLHAVTSSATQLAHLTKLAAHRGWASRLEVTCGDVSALALPRRFDRVVSVEMFEHLRNWPQLLQRIHGWLRPGGSLFLHVFCHRTTPYTFEDRGASDWMARNFFSSGLMPSADLIERLAGDLAVEERWFLPGTHYARTAAAWLANLDARRGEALAALAADDGALARDRLAAWRVFFMACEELFAWDGGSEWGVAHWLLRRT